MIQNETHITKVYISSIEKLDLKQVHYLIMSHKCYPISVRQLTSFNWLAEIEYTDYPDLLDLLSSKEARGKSISVKRVFKSTRVRKAQKDPSNNFLFNIAAGISGLIKKPVKIRITNNRANDWQKRLIEIWQKELDNPEVFKKLKIEPKIDISQNGELEFCIIKSQGYIITFFNQIIDEFI